MNENSLNLKTKDYISYLLCQFANEESKDIKTALFSISIELAEIPTKISDEMVAKIKFAWWREAINDILNYKATKPHPALLALKSDHASLAKLLIAIDEYEKLLDGQKPKTLEEISEFVNKTTAWLFNNNNQGLAYGLVMLAKKLSINSKFHSKFATPPEKLISAIISTAKPLIINNNSACSIITSAYINKLPKQPNKLFILCKLLFCAKCME